MITLLSLAPGGSIPGASLFRIPHFDKFIHFSMYAVLIFVVLVESRYTNKYHAKHLLLVLVVFLLSAMIEILQATLVPSRGAEWFDLLANFLGLLGGYLVFRLVGSARIFRFLRS